MVCLFSPLHSSSISVLTFVVLVLAIVVAVLVAFLLALAVFRGVAVNSGGGGSACSGLAFSSTDGGSVVRDDAAGHDGGNVNFNVGKIFVEVSAFAVF